MFDKSIKSPAFCVSTHLLFLKSVTGSSFRIAADVMRAAGRGGGRASVHRCRAFCWGRVTMAGFLHVLLLVCLRCGATLLTAARPDLHTTPEASHAAFTATRSLSSAATEGPAAGSAAGHIKSTAKPPKTSTTAEPVSEDAGKTAERAWSRKDTAEEEGPLELGE